MQFLNAIVLLVLITLPLVGCGSDSGGGGGGGPIASGEDVSVEDAASSGGEARGPDSDVRRSESDTSQPGEQPDAVGQPDVGEPDVEDGGGTGPSPRTGNDGFCDFYKECGGTYYETAQECIDAGIGYWGECNKPRLDAFGDCMLREMTCDNWNPDGYIPGNTPCAEEWAALGRNDC